MLTHGVKSLFMKQNSSLFSLLPNIIIDELIFLWLELIELNHVDTSFCNAIDRVIIMEVMHNSHFSVDCFGTISNQFGKWLLERGVKLNTLELGWKNIRYNVPVTHTDNQTLWNTSRIDTSRLKSLKIDYSNSRNAGSANYPNAAGVASIINDCPLLEILFVKNVDTFTFESLSQINDRILKQITKLTVVSFVDKVFQSTVNGDFIKHIAAHCPNLTVFEMDCAQDTTNESYFITLVKNCPKLSILRIDYKAGEDDTDIEISADFLRAIAEYCPQLTKLYLPRCHLLLEFEATMNFILSVKNLKTYVMNVHKYDWGDQISYRCDRDNDGNMLHKDFSVQVDFNEPLLDPDGRIVEEVTELFEKCTDFTLIKFDYLGMLNNKIIETIAANNPRLSGISIENCGNDFSCESLRQLLIKCKELTYMQVFCHSDMTLDDIGYAFCIQSSLTILLIVEDGVLSPELVIAILKANPQLKCLSICGDGFGMENELVVRAYLVAAQRPVDTFEYYDGEIVFK